METFEDVFPTELWFSELAGQIRLVKYYSIWPELAMLVYRRVYYLPQHTRQLNKNALPEKSYISFVPRHSSMYGTFTYTWLNMYGRSI